MDQILSELGVVNEVEEELRLQLQSLVEENERQLTPSAAAAATTAGDYNNGNDISSKCNKETKKTAIMSILEGANSAQEVSSSKIHSQRKIYKRDEKVKFIADLEDIPNTHDNEMKFNGGKRGYYDSSTSLNLFSSCSQGGMYEYRSSTNVDQNALRELVREAKKRRIQSSTSCSSHTASVASIDNGYPLQDRADSVESDVNSNDGTATSPDQLLSKDVDQATAPPHDPNSFIISDNSDDVSGEVMCPICNRSIANSNAPSNAALIDRHIERCARRGSRNIRNYDEDFSEQSQSVHSASTSAGASTSDRSRGGRSSRGQQAAGRRAIVSYPDPDEEEDGSAGESDWESMGATRSTRAQSQRAIITPSGSASSFECDAATSAAPRTSSSSANSRPSTRSAHVPVAASFGFAPAALSRSSKKKNVAAVHSHHAAVYGEETVASFAEEEDEDSQNDDDDAVGFVASIADDWEDHIYDARLVTQASQAAAVAHKKKHAKKNETHGEHIANNVNGDANLENQSEYVRTDYGTEVLRTTWESLHQYQRDGCRWLHGLYDEGVGGILGDEMGLGKTAQVCTHFGSLALLHNENAREAVAAVPHRPTASSIFIVVCPATVLHHWLQEFHRWSPFMRTVVLHSVSTTACELLKLGENAIPRVLRKLQKKPNTQGLTVITTYEGLRKHRQALVSIEWTAVCLDEGQKIRNPATEITSTCKMLPAFHRLILSGTPIQNSLRELWSLFDFIYPGRLGSLVVFEQEFATPIRMGGYANANALQYEIAIRCASTLQKVVKPYLLRRKKDDLIAVTRLPAKTEQVLFCQISPRQREVYLNIISSSEVKAVMERRMMAFRAINTLRKLCNHPALVFQQGKIVWQQDPALEATHVAGEGDLEDADDDDAEATALLSKVGSGGIVWADSGKLLVLSKLLPLWYSEGHKVLIFSQTRGMLSVIESMVRELGFLYLRLDGSTPVSKRAGLVNKFNTNPKIFVMLLTTRTGGVGISLTAANRVVLFDPDWNPMTDIQSRERAWRLGQKREVTVYRLITRGTIEEKIYQRQIFKLLLSNRILDNAKQKAMFSQTHMKELFELNDGFSKGGHDRHGYAVGGESLPVGGEVALKADTKTVDATAKEAVQDNLAPEDTSQDHQAQQAGFAPGGQFQQFGEHGLLDVEDYVEPAPLSAEQLQSLESAEEPGADGSTSRDRRLLQALFAGDAITSVYDHHYFDPTTHKAPASLPKAAERVSVRQEATSAVNRALNELQSSATVYRVSTSTAAVSAAAPASAQASGSSNSRNSSYGDFNQITIVDSVELAQSGEPLGASSRPKFGASSASFGGTSSAAFLAGLSDGSPAIGAYYGSSNSSCEVTGFGRASSSLRVSVSVLDNPYVPSMTNMPQNAPMRVQSQSSVSTPSISASVRASASASTSGGASSSQAKLSVKQDIQSRLAALFSRADRPLSTSFVLSRFKDLGDQYAPLFRELLRGVATHNNGMWNKKSE